MKFILNKIREHCTGKNLFILVLLFSHGMLSAQEKDSKKLEKEVNRYMQLAEKALAENNFPIAEANYRKAIAADTSNAKPTYNLGTLYYLKNKTTEATGRLYNAGKTSETKSLKHRSFHNQGNTFMKDKNYKAAVEAYKNALRNDPTDDETRYNLAVAKSMLKKEEQKQDKDSPKKDDGKDDSEGESKKDENEKKKENQDQNKEDSGEDQKDKKEEPKDQNQKDQQDQGKKENEPKNQNPQQPKPTPGKMSQQQIKNLLEAMKNQEQDIQEKINAQKAKGAETNSEKDW